MEIAQTSQERREILERSCIGGTLSEDDSESETSSISADLPFDVSDEM